MENSSIINWVTSVGETILGMLVLEFFFYHKDYKDEDPIQGEEERKEEEELEMDEKEEEEKL